MDFARKQLEKYGWTDGKGLGKNENGISHALKPKLKRSVTGVGHDPASEFNEHWWTMLYDKAASNVEVKESDGKTKKINAKEDFTITNNTWQMKQNSKEKGKKQYSGFFVRTAVMNGGSKTEIVRDTESDEEVETREVLKMTDEELFAACEGRTAHKGARHGLKALGKLARIAQQEEQLLSQPKYNGYSHAKKTKENKEDVIEEVALESEELSKRKKKNKKKQIINNTSCEFQSIELTEVESRGELERENGIMQVKELSLSPPKYKGYSHAKKRKGNKEDVIEEVALECEEVSEWKKKNKRKQSNNITSCEFEQIELVEMESKKEWESEDRITQEEELSLSQPKYNGYSHVQKRKEIKEDAIEGVVLETEEVLKWKKKNKRKQSNNETSCEFEQIEVAEMESKRELEREDRITQKVELSLSPPKYNEYSHVKKRKGEKEDVVEEVTFECGEVSKRKKKHKRKRCVSNENRSCEIGQIELTKEEPIGELEREDEDVCETVGKDSKCKESVKNFNVVEDDARDRKKRRKRKNVEETDNIIEDVTDEKIKKKKKTLKNT